VWLAFFITLSLCESSSTIAIRKFSYHSKGDAVMCTFNCVVGESLRIGDVARLHIRGAEQDQVWLSIKWAKKDRIPIEIIALSDDDDVDR